MRQKLYKRLAELERVSAGALRARMALEPNQVLDKLREFVDAWAVDPRLEKLLAEAPPDFIYNRVQELRRELMARAFSGTQMSAGVLR